MSREITSEYGEIKIHCKVISEVAELAAKEVEGVKKVGLDCYGLIGKILRLFRVSAVKVSMESARELKVSLPIVVDYNFNAVEVACHVQRKVAAKLLQTLNIDFLNVDVKVKRIERG
ncbi:MAG: Asp23/Gls24 family envelope stress response protein [Candidatus Omnitrophica bacterium]|nr:Asp23/Gls24 family envelope stress response protein [Candidatus Omnitrophota bacterium]